MVNSPDSVEFRHGTLQLVSEPRLVGWQHVQLLVRVQGWLSKAREEALTMSTMSTTTRSTTTSKLRTVKVQPHQKEPEPGVQLRPVAKIKKCNLQAVTTASKLLDMTTVCLWLLSTTLNRFW